VEKELDRLYAAPLDEFIAERDALAKRLRSAGDRERIRAVNSCRGLVRRLGRLIGRGDRHARHRGTGRISNHPRDSGLLGLSPRRYAAQARGKRTGKDEQQSDEQQSEEDADVSEEQ